MTVGGIWPHDKTAKCFAPLEKRQHREDFMSQSGTVHVERGANAVSYRGKGWLADTPHSLPIELLSGQKKRGIGEGRVALGLAKMADGVQNFPTYVCVLLGAHFYLPPRNNE